MSRTLTQTARPMFGASAERGAHTSMADRVFATVVGTLTLWSSRIKDRETLADLDSRLLADIGVTRDEANYEANKPFWSA
ncbi:DUF1127 domain-containing protein [Thalassobaculum sp. OXR-137]|uniref:DUF1127 domain-containing protein n=1 Tax=Thalassobaculum sp. OXR-137 TaxID=3100173 RepID=UPI002AC8BD22|nr:DUF1127 domain-containing protein [Thalassobaculum sp. OXR-137]WPZ36117.1 DUF1127 domain-containing protein [Thalassobaculum sp. OXR-137]